MMLMNTRLAAVRVVATATLLSLAAACADQRVDVDVLVNADDDDNADASTGPAPSDMRGDAPDSSSGGSSEGSDGQPQPEPAGSTGGDTSSTGADEPSDDASTSAGTTDADDEPAEPAEPCADGCSADAFCKFTQGVGWGCECFPEFYGDGQTCEPVRAFGEACEASEQCASGLCAAGRCTVACTLDTAIDCKKQGAPGVCAETDAGLACVGDLVTGFDADDTIVAVGDSAMRQFQSPDDADLFIVKHGAEAFTVTVLPDEDDDLRFEVLAANGTLLFEVDAGGAGEAESHGVLVGDVTEGVRYVVVHSKGAIGGFKLKIE